MLTLLSSNWIWILLVGGMLWMHFGRGGPGGHGGHGGHGGCGGHQHSGDRTDAADGQLRPPREHHDQVS